MSADDDCQYKTMSNNKANKPLKVDDFQQYAVKFTVATTNDIMSQLLMLHGQQRSKTNGHTTGSKRVQLKKTH